LLLKDNPNANTQFNPSGGGNDYEGSLLQSAMTAYYTGTIQQSSPTLYANAVIPILNGSAQSAISTPTATMAKGNIQEKDVCFALSYQEALEMTGYITASPLRAYSNTWWLRTMLESGQNACGVSSSGYIYGSVIPVSDSFALRPAIWVKTYTLVFI